MTFLKQMLVIVSNYKTRMSPHVPKKDGFALASRVTTIHPQTSSALGPANPHTLCLDHVSNHFFPKHEFPSLSSHCTLVFAVPSARNVVSSTFLLGKSIFPVPAQISSTL